ncbi:MAG: glycosyltransferase [Flavobacteriaceae bacterium]
MFTILLYLFIAVSAILISYYLLGFSFFAFTKNRPTSGSTPPISVIICAKNEADNLQQFLPDVINQDYPEYEVVLINDASYDNTLDVMEHFQDNYKHVKIVNVENNEAFWGNKKYALTLGIKASTYDHLLFCDADCKPKSNNWIKTMSAHFSKQTTFVLGYGAYQKKAYSLLNALIRFETLLTAIQYFSYAKVGNPYMGVGRNLAYHKSEFFKHNGFMSHMQVKSGDDDLFINEAATKHTTHIEYSEESHTVSIPPKTFTEWFQQKRRHISTAKHYKFKDQFLLGTFYISQFLFWGLFIALISTLFQWEMVLAVFSIKLLLQYVVYGFSAKKLNEQNLIIAIPFLEIILIIFQFTIFITNKISKPNHWK